MKGKHAQPDLSTTNLGTIIMIAPSSGKGRRWLRAHVPDARTLALYESIPCEHRCGINILEGALAAGLLLEDAPTGRLAHLKGRA